DSDLCSPRQTERDRLAGIQFKNSLPAVRSEAEMIERRIDRANDRKTGEMGVKRARQEAFDLIRREQFLKFGARARPGVGSVGKSAAEDIRIPPTSVPRKSPPVFPRQIAGRAGFGFESLEQRDCCDVEFEARSRAS